MEGTSAAVSTGKGDRLKRKRCLYSTDTDTPGINESEAPRSSTKHRITEVIAFCDNSVEYDEFCNWYESLQPYQFKIPVYAVQSDFPDSVLCQSALKALMATKASMMGDRKTFDLILKEKDPRELEALGRMVTPFNEDLWIRHIKDTANEIVRQKYKNDRSFAWSLAMTEDALILYAEDDDLLWGAGISLFEVERGNTVGHGQNLLGEALMHVRDTAWKPDWVEEALRE